MNHLSSVMPSFASLVPLIAGNVTGCPEATIIATIRAVVRDICVRTFIWKHQVTTMQICERDTNLGDGTGNNNALIDRNIDPSGVLKFYPTMKAEVYAILDAQLVINASEDDGETGGGENRPPQYRPLKPATYEEIVPNFPGLPHSLAISRSAVLHARNQNTDLQDHITSLRGEPRYIVSWGANRFILFPPPDDLAEYNVELYAVLVPNENTTEISDTIYDSIQETITHGVLKRLYAMINQPWSDKAMIQYHGEQYSYNIALCRARANLGGLRAPFRAQQQPFL